MLGLALLPARPALAQAPTAVWQVATSGNNAQPTSGTSTTRATAVDPVTGNVYSTGSFTGIVTFGTTRLVSAGSNDVFVAKWDATAGAFTSAVCGGGTSNVTDQGNGIAVVSAGGTTSVYVTGSFVSGSSASIAGTALAGTGIFNLDVFVARYTDAGTGLANGGALSGGGTGSDIGYGIAAASADAWPPPPPPPPGASLTVPAGLAPGVYTVKSGAAALRLAVE